MKISKDTIVRTIILALALVNQILAIFGKGHINVTDDMVYQVVTIIITISASVVSWWKNNSFTPAAIKADEFLKQLKESDY